MAEALVAIHDPAAAVPHAQRSLLIAEKYVDGPEAGIRKRYAGDAHLGVAEVDRALQKWSEAQEYATQAIALWNSPEVKDADPKLRQQANAILAECTAHLTRK
jgi:hypothetical protein